MVDLVKSVEAQQLKAEVPDFDAGDTVRVHLRVIEGNRERLQVFEGVVLRRRQGQASATFTVRRVTHGVGVERTFLVHSPRVEKIERIRQGKVRRARLYYLRGLSGKAARIKEKRTLPPSAATQSAG